MELFITPVFSPKGSLESGKWDADWTNLRSREYLFGWADWNKVGGGKGKKERGINRFYFAFITLD